MDYPLKDVAFGKQLKAASDSGAKLALIFGDDEVAKGVVPAPAVALVAALCPRAVWSWCSDTAPVLAFDRDRPVAVVMPLARRIATA